MKRCTYQARRLTLASAVFAFLLLPLSAHADVLTVRAANPNEQGDGTMSAAARAAMVRGALPMNAAEVAAKAAATSASNQALAAAPASPAAGAAAGSTGGPLVVSPVLINVVGQTEPFSTPPDTTGAVGTTRYIQLVNRRYGIYSKAGVLIPAVGSSGTLNELAGLASTVNTFDPQIMWDAQTNRFYYVNDSIFSATDNRLSWGFSKTASPNTFADFCKYTTAFGARFPDYPKLGDSAHFLIVGVNSFAPSFVGSDIISFSKPPAGTTCPAGSTFKVNRILNIRDTGGAQTFTPVPSNQIDTSSTGYVIARNGGLPSTRLWFRSVTRNAVTGFAVYGGPRQANVLSYTVPPDAAAGVLSNRKLDTLDARPTQAVQSINPDRGTFSFWTQHTIASGTTSAVRWYEFNPVPAAPVTLRQGNVAAAGSFLFNGAISSDRRVRTGFPSAFGDSFVINYSVTRAGAAGVGINPRIVAGSSIGNIPPTPVGGFVTLQNSATAYVDFSCPGTTSTCRWGDYAGANPDPIPPAGLRGRVWGTNQWGLGISTAVANWRTKIFALIP
jgi:hypothetical protein